MLADSREQAEEMRDHLVRVGIDAVRGFIASLDGLDLVTPKLVQPEEPDGFDRALLLDVRNRTEYAAGHLPGAEQLSGGRVLWNLDRPPAPGEGTIVAYCPVSYTHLDVYKRQRCMSPRRPIRCACGARAARPSRPTVHGQVMSAQTLATSAISQRM